MIRHWLCRIFSRRRSPSAYELDPDPELIQRSERTLRRARETERDARMVLRRRNWFEQTMYPEPERKE